MTPAGKVFLVDDDAAVLKALARVLTFAGCDVEPFQSGSAFLARLPYQHPACLVLDQRMPDVCGLEVQLALNRAGACLPVVYLTGYGDVPTSVQAMKEGAFDFLVSRWTTTDCWKPWRGRSRAAARCSSRRMSARFFSTGCRG